MPGPNNKSKKKTKATNQAKPVISAVPTTKPKVPTTECMTLDEDEMTRCDEVPTHGYPVLNRCKVHHGQYVTMYKRYKEASKIVDEMLSRNSGIPTQAQIKAYTDVHVALEKARWMRRYVEAIRVEKRGREIHSRRFFLKVDDGHKIRIKLLAKKMISAVEILDALQAKAFNLHMANNPAREFAKDFQESTGAYQDVNVERPSIPDIVAAGESWKRPEASAPSNGQGNEDDDLIDIGLRSSKAKLVDAFKYLLDSTAFMQGLDPKGTKNPELQRLALISQNTVLQYARRILFYDPVLSLKAMDKVSLLDLLLDPDFSMEDMFRFTILMEKRLAIGLLWWKDAVFEALAMFPVVGQSGNPANVGDPKARFQIVGGWIFNRAHKGTMTNEAWWHLLKALDPPADVENRFVRVCNNFEDLHSLLSFGAMGFIPPPRFCLAEDHNGRSSQASRNHLSLSGVIVTDMISPSQISGPLPSKKWARRRGCITWGEMESRSYIFGAIRNEPDSFTQAFLTELGSRPNQFLVVTRSDADPGQRVEILGNTSRSDTYQLRTRTFEAPLGPSILHRPEGQGEWNIIRSAVDVLFGEKPIVGYLKALERPGSSGWFFNFKKFPIKYFLVLDVTPGRHVQHLSRQVSWAALCAQKLASGKYSEREYNKASDVLFERHARDRLSWMPEAYGSWTTTKMA